MYENSTLYSHFCSFSPANVTLYTAALVVKMQLQPDNKKKNMHEGKYKFRL